MCMIPNSQASLIRFMGIGIDRFMLLGLCEASGYLHIPVFLGQIKINSDYTALITEL